MKERTLREIKEEYGISRRTIQGYEALGLVAPTGKTKMGYLLYDEKTVERIREIRFYQNAGFQVKQIKELIDAPADVKKNALCDQRKELMRKIEELTRLLERMKKIIEEQ